MPPVRIEPATFGLRVVAPRVEPPPCADGPLWIRRGPLDRSIGGRMRRSVGSLCVAAFWLVLAAGPAADSGWTALPISTPAGTPRSSLLAVSCASPTACTAVGDIETGGSSTAATAQR